MLGGRGVMYHVMVLSPAGTFGRPLCLQQMAGVCMRESECSNSSALLLAVCCTRLLQYFVLPVSVVGLAAGWLWLRLKFAPGPLWFVLLVVLFLLVASGTKFKSSRGRH